MQQPTGELGETRNNTHHPQQLPDELLDIVVKIIGGHLALEREHMKRLEYSKRATCAWFVVRGRIPLAAKELLAPASCPVVTVLTLKA